MIRLKRRHNFEWAELWKMTPRQMVGVLTFAEADAKRQLGDTLAIHTMAARGDPRKVRKQIKDLARD